MADKKPKIEYKLVEFDGKEMVASKFEDDLNWVINHDHQEKERKAYKEDQENGSSK